MDCAFDVAWARGPNWASITCSWVRFIGGSSCSHFPKNGSRSIKLLQGKCYPIIDCSMLTADQRRLLGEFIRAHRERARPVEASGRRRTPGLRREELAAKAGISATWCAWIEQGRPVQASSEALDRLARALSLSRAERDYLFELAGRSDPDIRARSGYSGVFARSRHGCSLPRLRSRPLVGRLLLEQSGLPAFSRLVGRRQPAKSLAVCVS
jgi:transcriptional regulator with XRE-family HTH domain